MTGYPGVAGYIIYFVLALIVTFVIFTFYFILEYLKATGRVTSGTDQEFDMEGI